MCDYSLEHVTSRDAKVADRLISTTFPGTSTRGFASAGDLGTAVCLRPGSEIAFDACPRYEHPLTFADETASSRTARFRQIQTDIPHVHHDAVEFSDGMIVPLARLMPGQWATVLQLPSMHHITERKQEAEEGTPA